MMAAPALPKVIHEPEAVVRAYFADLSAGRGSAARTRLADDYVLDVVGKGSWTLGGVHQGAELSALMRLVRQRFPKGLALAIGGVTAQGDRVVVEASSLGTRCDGRQYQNEYAFIFTVRDGLIVRQREFCDIIAADEILCGPLKANDGAAAPDLGKGVLGKDN